MAASPRSPVTAALDDDLFDDSVVEDTIDGSAAVRWDPKFPMPEESRPSDVLGPKLTVAVVAARGLPSADAGGASDPFVKLWYEDVHSRGHEGLTVKVTSSNTKEKLIEAKDALKDVAKAGINVMASAAGKLNKLNPMRRASSRDSPDRPMLQRGDDLRTSSFGRFKFGETRVIKKTLDPEWNESFTIEVTSEEDGCPAAIFSSFYCILEVWDADQVTADELLGACRIYPPSVFHGTSRNSSAWEQWVPLAVPEGTKGEVLVRLAWERPPMSVVPGPPVSLPLSTSVPPSFKGDVGDVKLCMLRNVLSPLLPIYKRLYKTMHIKSPEEQVVLDMPPVSEVILYSTENAWLNRMQASSSAAKFGSVYLTEYRLIFVPDDVLDRVTHETSGLRGVNVVAVPIGSISECTVVTTADEVELRLARKTATTLVLGLDRLDNPGAEEELQAICNEIGWRHAEGCSEFSIADHELPLFRRVCSSREQCRSPTPGAFRENAVVVKPQGPTAALSHSFRRSIALSEHGSMARVVLTAKGTLEVGQWGGPGPKVVELPAAGRCESLTVSGRPVNKQEAGWTDKFQAKIIGNQLHVRRVDEGHVDGGWSQRLVLAYTQKSLHDDLFDDDTDALKGSSASANFDEEMVSNAGRRILEEYRRMGVMNSPLWRYSEANRQYELCSTYTRHLVFPKSFPDDRLKKAAAMRSRERLPALTWLHPSTLAPLCRCAQPRSGLMGKNLPDDNALLFAIRDAARIMDPVLNIFDARPKLNANANAVKGKGFESMSHLGGSAKASITFCDIGNIHVMRGSLFSLLRGLDDDGSDVLGASAKWLEHLSKVLDGSVRIADKLTQGQPCLVHCSDGWDRTSQLAATAPLLLDPYYRTIDGFIALIEKDWLGFGHMFQHRCLNHGKGWHENETSPVFVQWLDCVHQIMVQYPHEFEFSVDMLVFLADTGVHGGLFGTFMGNSEQERLDTLVFTDTVSVWDYILTNQVDFLNIFYMHSANPVKAGTVRRLVIDPSPRAMVLWRELFEPEVTSERQLVMGALLRERRAYDLFPGSDGDLLARIAELEHASADIPNIDGKSEDALPGKREALEQRVKALEAALAPHVEQHEAVMSQREASDVGGVDRDAIASPSSMSSMCLRLEEGPPGSVVYSAAVVSLLVMDDASGKRVALYTILVRQTQPTQAEWTCRRRFSDFVWLEERLSHSVPNKLPRKTMFRSFKKDFLERRRTILNAWIKQIPKLTVTEPVAHFFDQAVKAGLDNRGLTDRVAESIIPK